MPRWGAERRARPLHFLRSRRPRSSQKGGRRKDARRIAFRCVPVVRLSALRLPSFKGGVSWRRFFGLAFLGVGKARVRSRIARTKRLVIAGLDPPTRAEAFGTRRVWIASAGEGPAIHGASQNTHWSRPFSIDHRVKPGGDEEKGSSPAMTTRRAQHHEGQTGKHAQLSGAAHARTVAGAPIAR